MNNFMISAKRFFTNKNTVTILGVIIILVILFVGYNSAISSATAKRDVLVAREELLPGQMITAEDVEMVSIQGRLTGDKIHDSRDAIVGNCVGVGMTIPEGSMFFKSAVVKCEEIPDSWLDLLGTDANGVVERPHWFDTDLERSFANAIRPGRQVDVFVSAVVKTEDADEEIIIFGKLIEYITILAVKDNSGQDVFVNQGNIGTPSHLFFGIQEDLMMLLRVAMLLDRAAGIELVVVPHGGANPTRGEIEVSSAFLRDFIESQAHLVRDMMEEDEIDLPFFDFPDRD